MNALEEDIQNLIGKPVALDELAEMSRMFTGAMKCLMVCLAEARNEGGNINKSINEGAGRRTQLARSKYTPFRLCEAQTVRSNQDFSNYREFYARQA